MKKEEMKKGEIIIVKDTKYIRFLEKQYRIKLSKRYWVVGSAILKDFNNYGFIFSDTLAGIKRTRYPIPLSDLKVAPMEIKALYILKE